MKNSVWYGILFFAALVGFASCNSDDGSVTVNEDQLIEDHLTEKELLDSMIRDDSGIYYKILTENPGGTIPTVRDRVGVFYTANVVDMDVYDANVNDGTNLSTKLQYGANSAIPIGLDNCLGLLKVGEIGAFYLPPSLAYSDLQDLPSGIPPNSVIRLVIELVSSESEAEVFNQEIALIEQFIIDYDLNDSIWAAIDTVMTPVDSLWVPNLSLTYDSVMVPVDSVWYDVVGGEIPVDSVFLFVDSVEYLGSGIYYQALTAGIEGTRIPVGDLASIGYQLYTLNSYPNAPIDGTGGSTFDFFLQQGIVITGLDAGILVMEHDERAILIMPSNRAYEGGVFVIPASGTQYFVDKEIIPSYSLVIDPFEVLVFDVTLLSPPN